MLPTAFPPPELMADVTARILLEVEAVHVMAEKPFVFTSGWASPVYIDCRKLIAFPRARGVLMDFAAATILREVGVERIDAVAGGETAGIPFAAWLAERLMLPMLYVRKQAKGFGRMAQIEGHFEDGARVLLVEDLATDGRSKEAFTTALRDAGARVDHAFVLFHYGIFAKSADTMAGLGIRLHALATWWDVLRVAKGLGTFEPAALAEVEAFLHDPVGWSGAHGGATG